MRRIGTPEPGYFRRRLAAGGPWVSVRFFYADGALCVEVDGQTHRHNGEPYNVDDEWPVCWPSDETEYKFFATMREWAQRHAPHHPAARPRERIDLHTLPPRTRP